MDDDAAKDPGSCPACYLADLRSPADRAEAAFALDPESVPTWCPRCRTTYCRDHWMTWDTFDDGFYDARYGRCPAGHERKLWD